MIDLAGLLPRLVVDILDPKTIVKTCQSMRMDDFVSAKIEDYSRIAEKSLPALKKYVEKYGKDLVVDAIEGQIEGDISEIDDKEKRDAATKALRGIKSKL
jgi:hypothetical protein